MSEAHFPPLFTGHAVDTASDPFKTACDEAIRGCDAGLVVYHLGADRLRAAIVFAPDVALRKAMTILPLCAVGFQNALGVLAPPEVAVHLDWDGGLRLNGASCGRLSAAASTIDPEAEPGWLVIGLELQLLPLSDDPGHMPDKTSLYGEGCGEVNARDLLEAWVKHTLVGINTWIEDGPKALNTEWGGLVHGMGENIDMDGKSGTFLGVDEDFGLLIKSGESTHLVPLTHVLKEG